MNPATPFLVLQLQPAAVMQLLKLKGQLAVVTHLPMLQQLKAGVMRNLELQVQAVVAMQFRAQQ